MKAFTKEWLEEIKKRSYTEREYLKKTKGWTNTYWWVGRDFPDGADKAFEFSSKDGHVTDFRLFEKPSPSDLFGTEWDPGKVIIRGISPIRTWEIVLSKEWTLTRWISDAETSLEGRVAEVLKDLTPFVAFVNLASLCTTEYYTRKK